MANRTVYNSATPGAITGDAYMDHIAGHLKRLYDAAALPLTAVGGTANAVTATLDPVLDASGLVAGMRFGITWASTNTGAMTLAVNGGAAVSVLDVAGTALTAGAAVSGARALLEFVGGAFRIIAGSASSASVVPPQSWIFTASGTWAKPAGLDDDRIVIVRAWGGGGGGADTGGGGGGARFVEALFRAADVPASVTVTIGAGGAGGNGGSGGAGGSTTFGVLLTAWGGGGGKAGASGDPGGGGGGVYATGGTGASGSTAVYGGGAGGVSAAGAGAPHPGGGGGGGGAGAGHAGGDSEYGGGGGGGCSGALFGAGGRSLFGGNGGSAASGTGVAGFAPGGGGGAGSSQGGAGARGEVRIFLI